MASNGRFLIAALVAVVSLVTRQFFAGKEMNGREMNGREMNGREMNGREMNGASLNDAFFDGISFGYLELEGSVLTVVDNGAVILSGGDLVGFELAGLLDDGSEIALTIDGFDQSGGSDIAFYTVSYQAENDDGVMTTYPLCGVDDDDNPIPAIALSGLWNYEEGVPGGGDKIEDLSSFTFACQGYALAKCVEFGYQPWETVTECKNAWTCHEISLAHHHQSCVRMLRADFCGDGMPHTQDGTGVNLWDDQGIQTQASTPLWLFEAEWGTEGATCVSTSRLYSPDLGTLDLFDTIADYALLHCPGKLLNLLNNLTCGGSGSDFYVKNGYYTPADERSFLMTKSETLGLL